MPPSSIAVLGGGITGLSAAFHLSRRFPRARITLLEKSAREGGWIQSRRVDVKDADGNRADVLLEAGPRTLRLNSGAVLELVNLLDLSSSLVTTPKSSPAARHRFLHIPGRPGLTRIPSSPLSLLASPYVSACLVPPILLEAVRRANRPEGSTDESLDAFLTRRFDARFARIFGSALVHGIFAADARVLSTRAAFPMLLEAEERGGGSVVRGMLKRKKTDPGFAGYDVGGVQELTKDASVFSFVDGMETIPRALKSYLTAAQNVTVRTNAEVTALRAVDPESIEVSLASGETTTVSHVVSALPLPKLKDLTSRSEPLPHLTANPFSSVTVINIVFPPSKAPIHPPGFGYLVPRAAGGYGGAPNTGFLGAVFDSCALPAQDRGARGFARLTAMLGGPHVLAPAHTRAENVLAQLQHHLAPIHHLRRGARLPWPVHFEAREQRACIPVPTVGHVQRMDELRDALRSGPWRGRLEVVGAGVGGVSVGDCVEAGRNAGKDW
ncbi:Protoporphyrinogen oxidase [Phellopilus nigrolimitatus]|nr:Protoporphyrinogen oxidase [Phellopilus nigrolimitatus]